MARLSGRVAVVTGGGSGIGAAIAGRFAAEGARVAIADVNRDGSDRVAASIRDAGGVAIAVPTDVADSAQVEALFARVVREWGTVDILSNNAGIGELSPALRTQIDGAVAEIFGGGARRSLGVTSRMDDAEWRRMIEIHLFGTFYCTRAALRIMEERGTGAIVNMASVAGLAGSPMLPAYSASKHAVVGLTRSAARSYGRRGIRVNCVCPGPVETPLAEPLFEASGMRELMLARQSIGRFGTAEEVAALVLWLLSPAASLVTGTPVRVDAGALS